MAAKGVTSLRRGLGVLNDLADGGGPATATEIAATSDQSRVHVSRILADLELASLVSRDAETRDYSLDVQMYTHAKEVSRARLFRNGHEVLAALAEVTTHAAFVVELRGASSVTVLEAESEVQWMGRSYPAYCDDGGQALLFDAALSELEAVFRRTEFVAYGPNAPRDVNDFFSRLEHTRTRGYSITDEEVEPGVLAIAAPIRDFSGQVACAVHIEGPRERMIDNTEQLGTHVLRHAALLSECMGYSAASRR